MVYPKVVMLTLTSNKQDTLVLIELDYLDSSAMQLKRKMNSVEAVTVLFTGDWVSVVAC